MENEVLKVGTLILDDDKIGVITRVIKSGSLKTAYPMINWRENYEIHYYDGIQSIMGQETVKRLIAEGKITVVYDKSTK